MNEETEAQKRVREHQERVEKYGKRLARYPMLPKSKRKTSK